MMDVLDGTHGTDRIQSSVIEGLVFSPDAIVYVLGGTIYARQGGSSSGTLIWSATNNAAGNKATINKALEIANVASGKATVLITPGTYLIDGPLVIYNNTTLYAYNVTLDCTSITGGVNAITGNSGATGSGGGNANIKIFGLTVNHAAAGGPVKFISTETSAASDITLRDCFFKNANSSSRMLYVQHTYPGSGQPTVKNTNIRLVNCDFDGANGAGANELVRIENTRHAQVLGCRFYNTTSTRSAALHLYGACVDCVVANTSFWNNDNSSCDLIVTQSVNMRIGGGNSFLNRLKIVDCLYVNISNNIFRLLEIVDVDAAIYDGITSVQRGSQHISISNNLINNIIAVPLVGTSSPHAILLDLVNVTANPPKYISVIGNTVRTAAHLFRVVSMTGTVANQVERLSIINNQILETSAESGDLGIIVLNGNASWTNGGFRDVYISGNYIAPTLAGTVPSDVYLGRTTFLNVVIRQNWFNNDGVFNTNSYAAGVTHNHGTTAANRYSNSGTASISSGTTVTVTHGVSYTPLIQDIQVTPTTDLGAASKFWVSSPGATTFVININTAATPTFAWQVRRNS